MFCMPSQPSSASLAQFMNFYFSMIFDDVRLVNSTSRSEIFEQLFRIGPDDIIIGISFPRYSKRIVQGMEFAKQQKAMTVAITDSMDSPLVEYADDTLVARSEMASFVDSLVAPLSVINAMIVAIGKKKQEEVREIFNELENVWDKFEVYNKFSGQKPEQ